MKKILYSTVGALALSMSLAAHPAAAANEETPFVDHLPPHILDRDVQDSQDITVQDGSFNSHLTVEYRELAEFEAYQMYDWWDADLFAEKALAAADGNDVAPEEIGAWNIEDDLHRRDLNVARDRLMAAFAAGAKAAAPKEAAVAQASFDCWVEQQEEAWQVDHILACRKDFETAMDMLETAMTPVPVTEIERVYFDLDDDSLRPDALATIDKFVDQIENKDAVEIVVVGHADRSGTEIYNDDLSKRRADAVKQALEDRGLRISSLKSFELEARGESDPAVHTADGVPEEANRRVLLQGYALTQPDAMTSDQNAMLVQ
ncbi:MAG: OmpA family protein [Magnetospiraceae bacterium]